jgi:hypothetical protein
MKLTAMALVAVGALSLGPATSLAQTDSRLDGLGGMSAGTMDAITSPRPSGPVSGPLSRTDAVGSLGQSGMTIGTSSGDSDPSRLQNGTVPNDPDPTSGRMEPTQPPLNR